MQLVDRKILEELLNGKDPVSEGEDSEISYSDFLRTYAKEIGVAKSIAGDIGGDIVEMTFEMLKSVWLKNHCPPIRYISSGSSRAAFACTGGKCLKVAIKNKGTAQNKQEIANSGNNTNNKYSCFSRMYDYDSAHYGSLLTECCAEIAKKDFKKAFGFKLGAEGVYQTFVRLKSHRFNLKEAAARESRYLKEMSDAVRVGEGNFEVYDVIVQKECVKAMSNMLTYGESSPTWKVLKDLNQFYFDHGQSDNDLLIDDINSEENWGLAIRDGKELVPVIIDSGFSDSVYNEYYV